MASFLYIEDDMLSRQVMHVILTMVMGYTEVTIFEDSTDFMSRITALSYLPDIILLDIHMRPHSGVEILHALRADPRFANTRIVALTASVMNEEVESLREAGFDGCIGKPINRAKFPELMKQLLAGEMVWNPI